MSLMTRTESYATVYGDADQNSVQMTPRTMTCKTTSLHNHPREFPNREPPRVQTRQKPFHVMSTQSLSLAWGTDGKQGVRVRSVLGKALDEVRKVTGQKRRPCDEAATQEELELDAMFLPDAHDLLLALGINGNGEDLFSGMDLDSPPGTPTGASARTAALADITPEKPKEYKVRRPRGRPRKDGLPTVQRKPFAADSARTQGTRGTKEAVAVVAVPVLEQNLPDDAAVVHLPESLLVAESEPGSAPPVYRQTLFSFFNVRNGLSPPLDLTAGKVDMYRRKKRRGIMRARVAAPDKLALPCDMLCHESNAWMDNIEKTWAPPFRPVVRFTISPAARYEPPQSAFDIKTMRLGQALGMGHQFPLLAAA